MEITAVRIRRLNSSGKTRAFASITLDHMFVVHDLRVVEGSQGMFVSMPSRKVAEGDYRDTAHPVTMECRQAIQQAVLEAYARSADGAEPRDIAQAATEPVAEGVG